MSLTVTDLNFTAESYTPEASTAVNFQMTLLDSELLLISPADAATGVSRTPSFSWSNVPGFSFYLIEVASDAGFVTIVASAIVNATSYQLPITLASLTTYHWRVKAGRFVTSGTITGVTVSPATFSGPVGSQVQFTATVNKTGDISSAVTWSSTNEAIATVNASTGLASMVAIGSATIIATAADGATTGSATVTVTETGVVDSSLEGQLAALNQLYTDTAGASWTNNTGWAGMTTATMGNAFGITTDGAGNVTRIDMSHPTSYTPGATGMSGNNLVGNITNVPWQNLQSLTYLNTKQNLLTGSLPPQLGQCVNLEYLYLCGISRNPSSDTEANGNSYSVWDTNSFTGALPSEYGNLVKLKHLEISESRATGSAKNNGITGEFPSSYGGLTNLICLWLQRNNIVSSIPASWGNLTNLLHLYIRDNTINGPLPPEIGNLTNLRTLNFSFNTGSVGEIPAAWAGLSSVIDFTGNVVSGPLPEFIANGELPLLTVFNMANNEFSGVLPDISNMGRDRLATFDVRNNSVSRFPSEILTALHNGVPAFKRLVILNMGNNALNSTLPADGWGIFGVMRNILLGSCQLSGKLPPSMGDINTNVSTHWIQLNNNNFNGKIPENWAFWQVAGWRALNLRNNNLYGPITIPLSNFNPLNDFAGGFGVSGNRYTYSDIIPVLTAKSWNRFDYSPQQDFQVAGEDHIVLWEGDPGAEVAAQPYGSVAVSVGAGGTIRLDLSRINITGNLYQWRKNGVNISNGGRVSGATSHTLVITTAEAGDGGEYTLRITNANAPQLTESISEPITVTV